jgi:hypothetical protein
MKKEHSMNHVLSILRSALVRSYQEMKFRFHFHRDLTNTNTAMPMPGCEKRSPRTFVPHFLDTG